MSLVFMPVGLMMWAGAMKSVIDDVGWNDDFGLGQ